MPAFPSEGRKDDGKAVQRIALSAIRCEARAADARAEEAPRAPAHTFLHFRAPGGVPGEEMLLLAIAQDWELPIRHRANTFLEVFGNLCVQRRTSRYIDEKARELIVTLADGRAHSHRFSTFPFSSSRTGRA